MADNRKMIGAKVPQWFFDEVEDYCWSNRLKKSDFILIAIKEYMERHPVEGLKKE